MGSASRHELLAALLDGRSLGDVVPVTLDVVEHDPHATGGCFAGDLLRALMELPAGVWARHPRLYDRYRRVLRASATARRQMSLDARMAFWTPLGEIAGADGRSGEARAAPSDCEITHNEGQSSCRCRS